MPRFQPKIIHTTANGAPVVRVEMTNAPGVFATVDQADWQGLAEEGFPTRWFLNKSGSRKRDKSGQPYVYVRFAPDRFAGNLETVARTIMWPGVGRVVRYRDGNRLNLCRSNLVVENGHAPGQRWAIGDLL